MWRQERDAAIIRLFKANVPFHQIIEDFELSHEQLERTYNDWVTEQKKRGVPEKMTKVGPNEYRGKEAPNGR